MRISHKRYRITFQVYEQYIAFYLAKESLKSPINLVSPEIGWWNISNLVVFIPPLSLHEIEEIATNWVRHFDIDLVQDVSFLLNESFKNRKEAPEHALEEVVKKSFKPDNGSSN